MCLYSMFIIIEFMIINHCNILQKDLYEVLGVDRNSSDREIRLAYKRLCLKFHPDHNPDGREQFESIHNAYLVLRNPETRKQYDCQQQLFSHFTSAINLFHFHKQKQPKKSVTINVHEHNPNDIKHIISCTLEDLYQGGRKRFQVKRKLVCDKCYQLENADSNCSVCGGKVEHMDKKIFKVMINKGMRNGQSIMFKGEGDEHCMSYDGHINKLKGNIVFTVKQSPHSLFTRSGDNLFIKHSLTLTEALTGAFSFKIYHLDGRVLHIASQVDEPNLDNEIKNGDVHCIRNEGMPKLQSDTERGNLYVKFSVEDDSILDNSKEVEKILQRMKRTVPNNYIHKNSSRLDNVVKNGDDIWIKPSKVPFEEIANCLPESFI